MVVQVKDAFLPFRGSTTNICNLDITRFTADPVLRRHVSIDFTKVNLLAKGWRT